MSLAGDRATVMHALDALVNGARRDVWKQLVGNGLIGLAWLLSSERRTAGLTNEPAKALLESLPFYPMRAWGFVLLVFTFVAFAGFRANHAGVLSVALYCIAAYWVFWTVLYVIAYSNGDGAGLGVVWAAFWAMRNRTVGRAAPRIVRRVP